jgi:hypothetical protein
VNGFGRCARIAVYWLRLKRGHLEREKHYVRQNLNRSTRSRGLIS